MEHTPDPQLPVYEGNLFIFVFWGTWGLFQGPVGIFLEYIYIIYIYDKFSKVVVDFSSIRGQKIFGWMLIFNLF